MPWSARARSQEAGLLVLCQLNHHYHLIKPGLVR